MADSEESYMFLDDIIVKTVGVRKIVPYTQDMGTYPSIDLTQDSSLGVSFTDTQSGNVSSFLRFGPSEDGFMDIETNEPGVRLVTNGNVMYCVTGTANSESILHGTSASGHAFTNAGSLARLEIATACEGSSVIGAKTQCDAPGELILSASVVEIPQADFIVSDKIAVCSDAGIQLGNEKCPIKLRGATSITGNLTVSTNAIVQGDLVVTGNIITTSQLCKVDSPRSQTSLNMETVNANDLFANSLVVGDYATLNTVSANRMATQDLHVLGQSQFDEDLSCGGNATILGNLYCLSYISAMNGALLDTLSASHIGIGCEADTSTLLRVDGNASVAGAMSISTVTIGSPEEQGVTLNAFGDAHFASNVGIDGCLATSSIVPNDGALSITANTLDFNVDQIYFKSNAYVIEANITYASNTLNLGSEKSSDSVRNGSGLQILGIPDNAPTGTTLTTSLTWSSCSGLFDPSGNVVPAATRSKWVLDGGNFSMNSVDEKFNYMFSIDDGELNIWKTTVINGTSTDTQKVATFGRTRAV